MKKKILAGGLLLATLGLMFPLSNVIIPRTPRVDSPIMNRIDPQYQQVALTFETKCLDCHSTRTQYPWYFSLPVAGTVIREDVKVGLSRLDLDQFFEAETLSPVKLAEIEWVMNSKRMPPLKYTAMHWNAFVSDKEREQVLAWIHHERAKQAGKKVAKAFRGEPIQPLTPIAVDEKKAALGNQLFHETLLSKDNTISCASCHALNKGGTDQARFSTGVGGAKGGINSPTVYNSAFNVLQFWDGRAADLTEQAGGPVTNPIEMAAAWPEVIKKLQTRPQYVQSFQQLYPDGITQANIQDAIAEFEKTLVTTNSSFDQYLMGKTDALTSDEIKGYELFKSNGCATCHLGPAVGGTHFRKMGVANNYFADRGTLTDADHGRFNVTKDEADRHVFKVPTLRNVAVTYPYFHDGSVSELDTAVDKMAKYQLGKSLSKTDRERIVQFLHTLTGDYQGQTLR